MFVSSDWINVIDDSCNGNLGFSIVYVMMMDVVLVAFLLYIHVAFNTKMYDDNVYDAHI